MKCRSRITYLNAFEVFTICVEYVFLPEGSVIQEGRKNKMIIRRGNNNYCCAVVSRVWAFVFCGTWWKDEGNDMRINQQNCSGPRWQLIPDGAQSQLNLRTTKGKDHIEFCTEELWAGRKFIFTAYLVRIQLQINYFGRIKFVFLSGVWIPVFPQA